MARPHTAALIEDVWNRQVEAVLRRRGWTQRVVGHTGYGSRTSARVLGRVLLTREQRHQHDHGDPDQGHGRRGWRAFVTAPAARTPVTIRLGSRHLSAETDRGGYLDVVFDDHELEPGWQQARIDAGQATADAPVLIIGPEPTLGIVSDIDDTVISTSLPRPLIAAWNTFVRSENARRPVPGMAEMYADLLADRPQAPVVYVSTGAWNTAPTLARFLRRHGYPMGPMLLTDWGPTNSGWFRSGADHKRACLHRLAEDLPQVRWLLVGDDGQHDPAIYSDFARTRPDRVEAVAIRELTPTEQVLSHGLPVSVEELPAGRRQQAERVPIIRAPDGHRLLPPLRREISSAG